MAGYIDNTKRPKWPYNLWREVTEKTVKVDKHNAEEKHANNELNVTENSLKETANTFTKSNQTQDSLATKHIKNESNLEKLSGACSVDSRVIVSEEENEKQASLTTIEKVVDVNVLYKNDNVCVEIKAEKTSTESKIVERVYELNEMNEYTCIKTFSTEHDHYSSYLDDDVAELSPINTLIKATSSPDISNTEDAKQVKEALMGMLNSTLDALSMYKLFHDSYLLPVGSMEEHTKIGKVDEFDFGLILPVLAQEEYFTLISGYNLFITDPVIVALTQEICPKGGAAEAINNMRGFLKCLWAAKMMTYVPDGWTVLNPSGHSDSDCVAATFHLQRDADKAIVDFDLCFWVPLNDACLSKLGPNHFPQWTCLVDTCKDEKGLLYLVLPLQQDHICLHINSQRFALSVVEREALQKYGPDNGRLQCYKTCKCLISAFMPKLQKKSDCNYCFDCIISSYCMKNIVLYMASNHIDEKYWTKDKLPNRVVEAFEILTHCMKTNGLTVSVFFIPNLLFVNAMKKYNPDNNCVAEPEDEESERAPIPCVLPDLTKLKELYSDDPLSLKAVCDYEDFLYKTEWRFPEVICRVSELLLDLMEEDEGEKRELVEDPGWNLECLNLPEYEKRWTWSDEDCGDLD